MYKIMIADTNEEYVFPIEIKFLEELGELAEVEIYTNKFYFDSYFSNPRKSDLLIVSDELYSDQLCKHDIGNIFVLSENASSKENTPKNVQYIYKYASLKQIFNQVMFVISEKIDDRQTIRSDTEVIVVYSAVGGSGKSTVAIGLAAGLVKNYKRVLFIDAENIQNSHYFFSDKRPLPSQIIRSIQKEDCNSYELLKEFIRKEYFDYLPPFRAAISSMDLEYMFYLKFIAEVKASKNYDYIIVDTDSIFDDAKSCLFNTSEHIIMLTMQDGYSIMKTNTLLGSMSMPDKEKSIFVCSKYDINKKNMLLEKESNFVVSNYVENTDVPITSIAESYENESIQKLVFELL